MASDEILNFEALLAPISEDEPTGVELKEDENERDFYYRIKDAREAARAAERQLSQVLLYGDDEEAATISPPDWREVKKLALEALEKKTKDLWVASWLIESLTRLHGFAGLRDGYRLTRELVDRFWEGIHPRPDEDGYVTTVAQLTGLNGDDSEGALIAPIENIPITEGSSVGPFNSRDYRQAAALDEDGDPQRKAQRVDEGIASMEMVERAVAETSPDFFRNLLEDIDQSLEHFTKLGEDLESKCGEDEYGYPAAPPTSNIRNALQECRERVVSLSRHLLGDDEIAGEEISDGGVGAAAAPAGAKSVASGRPVATREDAFRTLLQVADFFRRTEPHSPLSYSLEQAVRWGKMSLPELMAELISESSARDDLFRRVGIPERESSDD